MNQELGMTADFKVGARARPPRWQPKRGVIRARIIGTLLLLDCICIAASFAIANLVPTRTPVDIDWFYSLLAFLPIYLVSAINLNAYGPESLDSPKTAVRTAAKAVTAATALLVLAAFCLKLSTSFSRTSLVTAMALSLFALVAARALFVRHCEQLMGGKPFSTVLLLDGDQPIPSGDFSILIASSEDFDPDRHDPDMYDRLAQSLRSVDRVVVACPPDRRASWAHALKGANIKSEIIAPELASLVPLGQHWQGDFPTVMVAQGPLPFADRLMKRAFDVCAAGGALLALSPLLLTVALLIRVDSQGPVFFVQTRIGRGNRKFRILKFRSMRTDACDAGGVNSTARDDDRITRVGRIIRKTSIDELPQLINVLRGDMSIVGPRPHALGSRAADKLFWDVDGRYWHRHAAKPGLTGLAQVRGYRGATQVESDLTNRLQADLEYLDNWTILRDIWIICLTVRVIFHRNAY